MAKRATMSDVAKLAGVSISTVSYILGNHEGRTFSEQTIERVNQAAEQLQYARTEPVRKLRMQEYSGRICLAYLSQSDRVHRIIRGIMEELRETDYYVMQVQVESGANEMETVFNQHVQGNIDGVICLELAGAGFMQRWKELVIEQQIPFVTTDARWSGRIASVELDYQTGAYELTTSLLKGDVDRICYLHFPNVLQMPQTPERLQGICRAVLNAERKVELVTIADPLIGRADEAIDQVTEIANALHDVDERTAILLDWADHNQFVLRVCQDRGLRIPIAALEQGTLSSAAFPQIQYSYLPLHDMGVAAANALLRQLKDPNDITHELLVPTLIRAE